MRIDTDHWFKSVASGERSQSNHGLAFEASDLNNRAGARCTGSQQPESAKFEFADIARNRMGEPPSSVDHGFEIGRQREVRHQIIVLCVPLNGWNHPGPALGRLARK